MALGMIFTLKADTDRIIIDRSCLFSGTLEELLKKLQSETMNIRTKFDDNGLCSIEVFFWENDYDNYEDGYEKKVLAILSENTKFLRVFSSTISVEAKFQPAL